MVALRLLPLLFMMVLVSCSTMPEDTDDMPLGLDRASFAALPAWGNDDYAAALTAFNTSCVRIAKKDPAAAFGPDGIGGTYGDWQPLCAQAAILPPTQARDFFEQNFTPYAASFDGRKKDGLFTGYFEASLHGSRTRHGPYQYPLRLRPDDLVMVDLGEFREDLRGKRIAGRVRNGRLKPYEDRAEITAGALDDDTLAFVWVDDPVDAFFLHIQGSGAIQMDDGSMLRVGYAGQNGHPYYAIGRELVKRGYMDKDDVSLQSIRAWLAENSHEADEIMNTNKSYVFLRELDKKGPVGGEGVVLTPTRSLAVDRTKIPYGVPVWLAAEPPAEGEAPLRRLMVAQDTGGAIRGAVRGDVFWGYGDRAAYLAGQMKSEGRYWLLLPNNIKDREQSHDSQIAGL